MTTVLDRRRNLTAPGGECRIKIFTCLHELNIRTLMVWTVFTSPSNLDQPMRLGLPQVVGKYYIYVQSSFFKGQRGFCTDQEKTDQLSKLWWFKAKIKAEVFEVA
jgi:hypothetical protein